MTSVLVCLFCLFVCSLFFFSLFLLSYFFLQKERLGKEKKKEEQSGGAERTRQRRARGLVHRRGGGDESVALRANAVLRETEAQYATDVEVAAKKKAGRKKREFADLI